MKANRGSKLKDIAKPCKPLLSLFVNSFETTGQATGFGRFEPGSRRLPEGQQKPGALPRLRRQSETRLRFPGRLPRASASRLPGCLSAPGDKGQALGFKANRETKTNLRGTRFPGRLPALCNGRPSRPSPLRLRPFRLVSRAFQTSGRLVFPAPNGRPKAPKAGKGRSGCLRLVFLAAFTLEKRLF